MEHKKQVKSIEAMVEWINVDETLPVFVGSENDEYFESGKKFTLSRRFTDWVLIFSGWYDDGDFEMDIGRFEVWDYGDGTVVKCWVTTDFDYNNEREPLYWAKLPEPPKGE